jgi:hypothetical protein
MSKIETLEDRGYMKVVCRLCGEEWLYPPNLVEEFDSDHSLECAYCKARKRRFGL